VADTFTLTSVRLGMWCTGPFARSRDICPGIVAESRDFGNA
jgi:hypothetical protein